MIASEKSPRTNAWAAHLAALGLAPIFGAFATCGLAAQTVSPAPHHVNVAFADDDDDDDDDSGKEKDDEKGDVAARLKELGDRFVNELGPAGEEVRKVWDRAVGRVNKTIEEDGLTGEGLRDALDDVRNEISSALEKGGPIDRKVRRALDRVRRELSEMGEETGRNLQESVRRQFRPDQDQGDEKVKPDGGPPRAEKNDGGSPTHEEIDEARKEVREIERKLHEAVRRLYVLQRRAAQEDRTLQGRRRRPGEEARPSPKSDGPLDQARPSESPEAKTEVEAEPPGRGPRGTSRRRDEFLRGRGFGRGPNAGPPPGMRPGPDDRRRFDNDRRFRELEEKMDTILKRLDRMNDEKKPENPSKESKDEADV